MKRISVTLLFSIFLHWAGAQNLVPNPSFEDYILCPSGVNQLENCNYWQNFGNSPDYWNECGPGAAGIPDLSFGYQYAHSGAGMAGIDLYKRPNSPNGSNYREVIGIGLQQTLVIGQKYFMSFYINYSCQLPIAIACNMAGIRFSTVAYDSCCPPPINNWAHLYSDSLLKDSVNWIKISGSIIADSSYSYLYLGNFFDDSQTDTLQIGNLPDHAYYYIDDVCVSTDSLFNSTWTSVNELRYSNTIQLFPNPTIESIKYASTTPLNNFKIFDVSGKLIMEESYLMPKYFDEIYLENITPGFYSIIFSTRTTFISKQFIKTN